MLKRQDRVRCLNKKLAGKVGTIVDMDRGNVWVKLDDGKKICTRMSLLEELGVLDKIAEAAKERGK